MGVLLLPVAKMGGTLLTGSENEGTLLPVVKMRYTPTGSKNEGTPLTSSENGGAFPAGSENENGGTSPTGSENWGTPLLPGKQGYPRTGVENGGYTPYR